MKRIVITTYGLRRYPYGALMELPAEEADDLVAGGFAVPVLVAGEPAAAAEAETAEPEAEATSKKR